MALGKLKLWVRSYTTKVQLVEKVLVILVRPYSGDLRPGSGFFMHAPTLHVHATCGFGGSNNHMT